MLDFKLIILEGLDCSGKTTASREIARRLQPATVVSFPDRTSRTGEIIDQYLKSKMTDICPYELHLLYSANRYEKASHIKELLLRGHVICDRYWFSGAAYSVAKGLEYAWCKNVDAMLPRPDYVFFIDADEQAVSQRSGFGDEAHDRLEFQKRVYETYKEMIKTESMVVIDGTASIESVVENILSKIK